MLATMPRQRPTGKMLAANKTNDIALCITTAIKVDLVVIKVAAEPDAIVVI